MSVALAFALSLLQQTNPAPATTPETPTRVAPVTVTANANPTVDRNEQIVCRREHVLGSNRPQRICAPRREWDRARDNAQDAVRDSNSREMPSTLPVM